MKQMKSQGKVVLGWVEEIDLPEFGMFAVPAKIDTGAYSGALHCEYEKRTRDARGKSWLKFKPLRSTKEFKTDKFERVYTYSTSGHRQERHRIFTTAVVKGQEHPLIITLSDRSYMTYDVIIGRAFLDGRFIVDVSKSNGEIEGKRQ